MNKVQRFEKRFPHLELVTPIGQEQIHNVDKNLFLFKNSMMGRVEVHVLAGDVYDPYDSYQFHEKNLTTKLLHDIRVFNPRSYDVGAGFDQQESNERFDTILKQKQQSLELAHKGIRYINGDKYFV